MNQKDIVYNIVKQAGGFGIRTEQVKIEAMRQGVSCPDRYLRYFQAEYPPKMRGKRKERDKTLTWTLWVDTKPKQQNFLNPVHQEIIDNITLKPITKDILT